MKLVIQLGLVIIVLTGCASNDLVPKNKSSNSPRSTELKNDITVSINGLDEEIELSRVEWGVFYKCKYFDGLNTGSTAFNILRKIDVPTNEANALLVFPDGSADLGMLYRSGLDWRFDWASLVTESIFSISIKQNGDSYYYNWNLADEEGRMNVKQTLKCIQ